MGNYIYTSEFGQIGQAILSFLRPNAEELWTKDYHSPMDFVDSVPVDTKLWNFKKSLSKEQTKEQFDRFRNGIFVLFGEEPKGSHYYGNEVVHFDIGKDQRQILIDAITYIKTRAKATREEMTSFIVDIAKAISDEIKEGFLKLYLPALARAKSKAKAIASIDTTIDGLHQRISYDKSSSFFVLHLLLPCIRDRIYSTITTTMVLTVDSHMQLPLPVKGERQIFPENPYVMIKKLR